MPVFRPWDATDNFRSKLGFQWAVCLQLMAKRIITCMYFVNGIQLPLFIVSRQVVIRHSTSKPDWKKDNSGVAGWDITLHNAIILIHRGRVTHICVNKLAIIGSDNGLSPGRRQAIIWTNILECIFIQENAFESVVRKLAAVLSRPQCVKHVWGPRGFIIFSKFRWRMEQIIWEDFPGQEKARLVNESQRRAVRSNTMIGRRPTSQHQ